MDVLEGMEGLRMTAERRSSHRTQWAAQFAVASELCKLGYEVALTLGNQPAADLLVVGPKKENNISNRREGPIPNELLADQTAEAA